MGISKKDFQVAIITMLHKVNKNTLEIHRKIKVFSRQTEKIKEIKGLKRTEQIFRDLQDIINMANICIIPKEKKRLVYKKYLKKS